jgi:hypothetical protein
MIRKIGILAAVLAAGAFASQPAMADDIVLFGHKKDKRVVAAGVVAGVGSAVAYESLIHWNWKYGTADFRWGMLGVTTLGCMAAAPMIAAALTPERELTNREVGVLMGSCVVPIIGGLIVEAIYDDHPEWEKPAPAPAKKVRKHKRRG